MIIFWFVFFIINDRWKQKSSKIYIYIIYIYNIYIYIYIYIRNIISEAVEKLNQKLYDIDWNEVKSCEHPSESYEIFLTKFLSIYDDFFPKQKIKVKSKDIQRPWITAGIKKSSKHKQRLYEGECKSYKQLFETIKNVQKKLPFINT